MDRITVLPETLKSALDQGVRLLTILVSYQPAG